MEENSSRRQKGNIITISRKAPCSVEQKRLQCGGGTGKGLEDCRKASIGVQGSAELWGHDSTLHYSIIIHLGERCLKHLILDRHQNSDILSN